MNDEWFEVAYINFSKAILHGRVVDKERDEYGCRVGHDIEQVLTDGQRGVIADMSERHRVEMNALLRSLVDYAALKGEPQ